MLTYIVYQSLCASFFMFACPSPFTSCVLTSINHTSSCWNTSRSIFPSSSFSTTCIFTTGTWCWSSWRSIFDILCRRKIRNSIVGSATTLLEQTYRSDVSVLTLYMKLSVRLKCVSLTYTNFFVVTQFVVTFLFAVPFLSAIVCKTAPHGRLVVKLRGPTTSFLLTPRTPLEAENGGVSAVPTP